MYRFLQIYIFRCLKLQEINFNLHKYIFYVETNLSYDFEKRKGYSFEQNQSNEQNNNLKIFSN